MKYGSPMTLTLLPGSFKYRLTLILAVLALCVGLPGYLYLSHTYVRALEQDHGNVLHGMATTTANALSENLRERLRGLDLVAQAVRFRTAPFSDPELTNTVNRIQQSYPHYSWIGFTDTEGIVRAATGNLLLNVDVSQRPWYKTGLSGSAVGDLHTALLLAKLLPPQDAGAGPIRFIDFSMPVRDAAGQVRGVLGAHAHWRWATEVVSATAPANALANGVEFFIINRERQIIYPEQVPEGMRVPDALAEGASFGLDNWGTSQPYMYAQVAVRELAPAQTLGWQVLVRQPAAVAMAPVKTLENAVLIGTLAMAVILLCMGYWIARHFGQPLEQLAARARQIQDGNESLEWDIEGRSTEVRHLVDALRGMVATLVHRGQALAQANAVLEQKVRERTEALEQANAALKSQARRDALTGLGNRLACMERLHDEFVRLRRTGVAYAVVMLDIDHFKRVNDTWGHTTGDVVLRAVAHTLAASVRETDFVGRFGGEEFLAVFPATNLDQALQVADKIRLAVQVLPLEDVGSVTLSIGVALAYADDSNEESAVAQADAALYRAKEGGRNRVLA